MPTGGLMIQRQQPHVCGSLFLSCEPGKFSKWLCPNDSTINSVNGSFSEFSLTTSFMHTAGAPNNNNSNSANNF